MENPPPGAPRAELAGRLAEFLTRRLGDGSTHSMNIGDCFLQTTVLDLADPADAGDWADPVAVESDVADDLAQGSAGPVDVGDGLGFPDVEESDEFASYGANGAPALRRALLIEINGLGCLAGPIRGWTPEADPWLDQAAQERMRSAGMNEPEFGLPLWWTRMETAMDSDSAASMLVTAFVDALEIPVAVVAADLDVVAARPPRSVPHAARVAARNPFVPSTDHRGVVVDPEALMWDYAAHLMMRRESQAADWPRPAGAQTAYFAIVDGLDQGSVKELVALAPAGPGSAQAARFRRCRNGWVPDPTLARRMARTGPDEPLVSLGRAEALEVERRLRF